jgi:hypothetical protein
MNSPFDDQRPKTGFTFQRPETSTGIPLRSTMSSYHVGSGKANIHDERPLTGGFTSRFNTKENVNIRSEARFNNDEFKGTVKNTKNRERILSFLSSGKQIF